MQIKQTELIGSTSPCTTHHRHKPLAPLMHSHDCVAIFIHDRTSPAAEGAGVGAAAAALE